jgi:hypothetical protein
MNPPIETPSKPLREVVMQFGFPIEKFMPGRGPKLIGRIGAVVFAVAGVVLLVFWAPNREEGLRWYLFGAGLVAAGIVLFLFMRRTGGGLRVLICPRGLVMAQPDRIDTCPWDQLKEVQEFGNTAGTKGTGTSFMVERKDGAKFSFNQANVAELDRFGKALLKETDRRKIPWNVQGGT